MRRLGTLAIVALAGGFALPAGGTDLSDGLREACRKALPEEMAREAAPDAVEDLDGDGVSEVIAFFRRELDVFFTDERDVDLSGPQGQTRATEQVDAVAVYRYGDGRWKKDDDLLHALR